MIIGERERERSMMSNIELLKIELKKRKHGNIQLTIDSLVSEFNRNRKNIADCFKVLGHTGYIQVAVGTWKYQEKKNNIEK